ncbi:MAG: chemotaxis response regulator protein-glutamate methylesterase [Zetaproteobacteria bacterium]|nr:MAG: chemotaxis response regulator protein-glutamate methylesterase [Zetaproteobacteria bacterium]
MNMQVAIVHRDLLALAALRQLVRRRAGWHLAWSADRADTALARCRGEAPGMLLLGLDDGTDVDAVRALAGMAKCPVVLVVDSLETRREWVFDALGAGARDVVVMDHARALHEDDVRVFWKKLEAIAQAHGDGFAGEGGREPRALLAIGASSGGPRAVARLLQGLRPDLPASVVVVMHLEQRFAQGMADWLGRHATMPVLPASEGDAPRVGEVRLAATNDHLRLNARQRWSYSEEPIQCHYRPSVDVCFGSIAEHWPHQAIGVLLTGMGQDGARGLKVMRARGWLTIAQDEQSSDVYGMPKAAVALGAAARVLSLAEMPGVLNEVLAGFGEGVSHVAES